MTALVNGRLSAHRVCKYASKQCWELVFSCGYKHNIALLLIICSAFACLRVHLDCIWVGWVYRCLRVGRSIISSLESAQGISMQDAVQIGVWNILPCTSFFCIGPVWSDLTTPMLRVFMGSVCLCYGGTIHIAALRDQNIASRFMRYFGTGKCEVPLWL